MGSLILFSAVVVFVYMSLWAVYALVKQRNDIADVAWGLGFFTLAAALFVRDDNPETKSIIALIMVGLWAVRLATHIAIRRRGKGEDGRYVTMREGWKFKRLQSYTNVFLTQGFLLLVVAIPIMLFFYDDSNTLEWYNFVGIAVWAIGLTFEAVGDYQLSQFLKNPANKGKVMRYGLWSFTRHPNYFGEISLWWGFYLFTLVTPFWYVGLIGPIAITYLIIGVSGIPMLEKRYKGNKEYEAYQKSTSAFFPLPPR